MSEITYAWAPITKSEEQSDGTLLVHGPAASSALDRDQQILAPDFLDRAMPDWFRSGANIREQHDAKKAVGVGVGLTKGDDGAHYVTARIVDPVAVQKVKHGVLRGFSVGIKNPRVVMGKAEAPNGLVTDGTVCELSVCDRPANSECVFSLAKADADGDLALVEDAQVVEKSDASTFGLLPELYERLAAPVKDALAALAGSGAVVSTDVSKADDAETPAPSVVVNVTVSAVEAALGKADLSTAGRKKAAASGAAMSDGSYPIDSKADLRKAIQAVGRGGADHDAIRAHIVQRAEALGLTSMIPDNWNKDGSMKDDAATKADEATAAKAEELLRDVRTLAPALAKADETGGDDETGDINGATAAIAAIAQLIISEAESLAQGNFDELCDIQLLCSAAEALKWFTAREEAEQQGGADMALADTVKADSAKTSAATEAAGEENNDEDGKPAVTKSEEPTLTKADVADLIKAAVAEANDAAEERITTLAADLAKAQQAIDEFRSTPVPGGPVLTRTQAQEGSARKSDADHLRAEARQYMAKADAVEDRDLREGYRDKARALLAKADA